ncbi:hypothetical protein RU94_GL000408 [Enterococcus asini]|nr:hypothetical protein RU94_GL000408 [Enterococcus asini]
MIIENSSGFLLTTSKNKIVTEKPVLERISRYRQKDVFWVQ